MHLWLARTATARGDADAARAEYTEAASWPSTFYGQLAALALGGDPAAQIRASRDPPFDSGRTLRFVSHELARAAIWLVGWGEPHRAQPFLLRLDDLLPDPADRALAARLADGFGLPDVAVSLARRAGRDGVTLLETGWPEAAVIPADAGVEPALALGLIRQESSFDPTVVSPSGARGLMQLMPATATQLGQRLGLPAPLPALTADPDLNVRLGTAYLRGLLDRFDGALPLAIAAYNAGPARVQTWLAELGDPRTGAVDMIDWLELIPLGETRNYVQRVIENIVIYRAHRGETTPHPLARWLR
jgi:soluble lytic murein transglycosylase